MAENSSIQWTDHTFNPWIGCTKVSPACDHCYAEALVTRWGGAFAQRRRTAPANWQQPRRWNTAAQRTGTRARVFCASLADVFDNQVPRGWREDLWHLIHQTPALDWLLLTKRPQNIARMLPDPDIGVPRWGEGWPNVWLGTTVENQMEADRRIPHLVAIPAQVHFLSCEPLLERFETPYLRLHMDDRKTWRAGAAIDWVICGGESGPGWRPMDLGWARQLRDDCQAGGVPFFFKQHSGLRPKALGRELDGSEWNDAPSSGASLGALERA